MAVTAHLRRWIEREYERGRSYESLASDLGVTKQALYHVRDNKNRVGDELEESFAKLAYRGSVDALRKSALRAYRKASPTQPPAS